MLKNIERTNKLFNLALTRLFFLIYKEHNHSHKRNVNEEDYGSIDTSLNALNSIDQDKIDLFLNSISSRNNLNVELIKRFLEYNNIQVEPSHKINERAAQSDQELYEIFRNSISYNNNPSNRILKRKNNGFRVKRDEASNKEELVKKSDSLKPIDSHKDEDVDRDPPSHSAIGVTLVLGFVFMLIIDQIGGKVSHRHLPSE
jgi:hypothetical protein